MSDVLSPKISVILTCFNRQDCISRSINSILWQTFANFELIIVDDCSTDLSPLIIESFSDPRIKFHRHYKNLGQNAAINSGLQFVKGEFIAFLDSDDLWFPAFLEVMHDSFESDVGFVYSNVFGGPYSALSTNSSVGDVYYQGFLSSMISIMIRSECIASIGYFDESYDICQDDKFCFLLARSYKFKLVPGFHSVAIGSLNSVTANRLRLVKGWERFFSDFRDEIILECGRRAMAKHYFFLAGLYAAIFQWRGLFSSMSRGIQHLFGRVGNYPKPSIIDLPAIIFSITLKMIRPLFSGRL